MHRPLTLILLIALLLWSPLDATGAPTHSSPITDPHYAQQWALTRIGVPQAWELGATGEGITIAIIDTGVDIHHPDLSANLLPGYNAITEQSGLSAVQDTNGHGTHVAGIAAASRNGAGIIGVAPRAKILPVKAMDSAGEGTDEVIAAGIIWATDHGANIINLSMGTEEGTKPLIEAVHYARAHGVLLIAAAGNRETDATAADVYYPASEPGIIAVTATDRQDNLAAFTLTGPHAALAAPGADIYSTYLRTRSDYTSGSGTSMAAPLVAGTAALVWSAHPELTASQVKLLLENSALDLGLPGRDPQYGFGLVNAYWALKFATPSENYISQADIPWSGGTVTRTLRASSPTNPAAMTAALTFPPKAFSATPAAVVPVHLTPEANPPEFPPEITPIGAALSVSWQGTAQKMLRLTLPLPDDLNPPTANPMTGIYRWNGARWLLVDGEVFPARPSSVSAGIAEPGLYRIGWQAFPATAIGNGTDPIATAVHISEAAFPTGTDTVILARANDLHDALAGAPLAYKKHAALLLTDSEQTPDLVSREIRRLHPDTILILGGSGVISDAQQNDLQTLAAVKRLAGPNRYATAAAIASELGLTGSAVLVNSDTLVDAAALAPTAARRGIPILFSTQTTLPIETAETLVRLKITRTLIAGGKNTFAPEILADLPNAERFSGDPTP